MVSSSLADEKRPKEAAFLVHVHSGGVGHSHKQAVAAAEREQPPLVGGVQGELGAPGPAGGAARLHQQDRNRVGAHLVGDGRVSEGVCCVAGSVWCSPEFAATTSGHKDPHDKRIDEFQLCVQMITCWLTNTSCANVSKNSEPVQNRNELICWITRARRRF